jgi:hypothetical protein
MGPWGTMGTHHFWEPWNHGTMEPWDHGWDHDHGDTPLLYVAPIESATRPMPANRVVLLTCDFLKHGELRGTPRILSHESGGRR